MKAALLFLCVLLPGPFAYSAERSGIVGKWTWTRAQNDCTEVYDYRADGNLYVQSGAEKTESTYSIAPEADRHGYFAMTLRIVNDFGGKDCADSAEDSAGQENTVQIKFDAAGGSHVVCRDPNSDACFGPLRRLPD